MFNPVEFLTAHPMLMPFAIFFLRIGDVSLDTIRLICVVRGMRLLATCLAFVQVLIWIVGISAVMKKLDDPVNMIAYAAGFAAGTWVGIWLESRLALGQQIVRLISYDRGGELADQLRREGFVVTELEGHGRDAPAKICFIAAQRRQVPELLKHAAEIDPDVFLTVEDVRSTNRLLVRHSPGQPESVAPLKVD